MSPAMSTTSTCSSRTVRTSASTMARWASARFSPWNCRPRCQSEVWINRMLAMVGMGCDSLVDARSVLEGADPGPAGSGVHELLGDRSALLVEHVEADL